MSTGERLQRFLNSIDITTHRFEIEAGLAVSSASRVIQGKHEFSTANLLRIYNRYPELNLDWFLTGRGEMFVDKSKADFSDQRKESIRTLEQRIEYRREIESMILQSRKTLEKELSSLKEETTYSRRRYKKPV